MSDGTLCPEGVLERFQALAQLHRRATALDPRGHALPAFAAALEREIAAPLLALTDEASALVGEVEAACDTGDRTIDELDLWSTDGELTDGGDSRERMAGELCESVWQHIADLCFTARGELRRAARALAASALRHEDRLIACEGARRKLRRGLAAVLAAGERACGCTWLTPADRDHEAEAAVAVRRMYAKFRGSLAPCDGADGRALRRALRYASVSLAVMVGHADFAEVRLSDRVLLLGLQQRILDWARTGGSDAGGLQLYKDILAAADLLRSINQRQELQPHDQAALAELRDLVAAGQPLADCVPALRALQGRDDELDVVLAAIHRGEADASHVARLHDALGLAPATTRVGA
jgi:hypothetical protein